MNATFMRILGKVSVGHLIVIGCLLYWAAIQGYFTNRNETFIPVEFKVVVPPNMVTLKDPGKDNSATQEVKKNDIPDKLKPKADLKQKSKNQNAKIKVDKMPPKALPGQTPLSAEEIKKRLLQGAEISNQNVIPEDESLIFRKMMHDVFYNAWQQPSRSDVGDVVVEAEVTLGPDGSVLTRRIARGARLPLMDDSVEQALQAVKQVHGLTEEYIRKGNPFVVTFRVEDL